MICKNCQAILEEPTNFCANCGTSMKNVAPERRQKDLNLIIAFYIVELIFLTTIYFVYSERVTLFDEIIIESCSAIIILGFVTLDFKNILPLYRLPKIDTILHSGVLIVPFITGFLVYYGTEFINLEVFGESYNYYSDYVDYPNPLFWAVLFIAITPPIFEELAYRGFLFNQLLKVSSARVTIILTAFIFSLVHFSMISLLWIFPFGLLLGYLRHKYNTLWLGMIIHFIHNLIVFSLDYHYFNIMGN